MSETKHTPGPWRVSQFGRQTGSQITVMGADDFAVARCMDRTPEEHEADARLIAAAPEMYDALKRLWLEIQRYEHIGHEGSELLEVMSDAREAIAKAEASRQPPHETPGRAGEER